MEGEIEGEKHRCMRDTLNGCISHTHNQELGPQLRHVPWLEVNWWPLGSQASAQYTEPQQPGLEANVLMVKQFGDEMEHIIELHWRWRSAYWHLLQPVFWQQHFWRCRTGMLGIVFIQLALFWLFVVRDVYIEIFKSESMFVDFECTLFILVKNIQKTFYPGSVFPVSD